MKERLQKIIAQSGLASRRKAEQLIQEGRVQINSSIVTELGTKADPEHDTILVDGLLLEAAENKVYVLLHKPYGYITSLNDPEGRPTVIKLLRQIKERIYPVGRLDYDTEGLLILTNDGNFAQILQHPKTHIPRTYLVKVKGIPSKLKIDRLQKGISIDGIKTHRAIIKFTEKTQKNPWLKVVIWEGRNRQIKKMFEQIGHNILRIIRTEFGPLCLGNLPSGSYRFLNKKEIGSIKKLGRQF
jgi:23S rRNA pseudouridine2605 synthase